MAASSADIQKILADMRCALSQKAFEGIPRKKNMNTLARLGLTWEDVKQEMYDLSEQEYYQGPSVDRDNPASDLFWVFKKRIEGNVIYIKFKVLYQEDGRVKAVSFHIDEYPA